MQFVLDDTTTDRGAKKTPDVPATAAAGHPQPPQPEPSAPDAAHPAASETPHPEGKGDLHSTHPLAAEVSKLATSEEVDDDEEDYVSKSPGTPAYPTSPDTCAGVALSGSAPQYQFIMKRGPTQQLHANPDDDEEPVEHVGQ